MTAQTTPESQRGFSLKADAEGTELTLAVGPPADEQSVPEIMAALAAARLALPVDEDAVKQAARKAGGGEKVSVVVVKGQAPAHGRDGQLVWSKKIAAQAQEQGGRMSHYVGRIRTRVVGAADPLAKVTPETKGVDGKDIYGQVIKARNGKVVRVLAGPGAVEKDGIFFAEKAGIVRLDHGKIVVDEMLTAEGTLSFDTGNIDFPGTVIITGGVLDLFEVKAGGAVEIGGLVEAAKITAGGDIEINGGVAGKKKGTVRAGGTVHTKFLVNAEVYAEGSVTVETQIVTSKVMTLGAVSVARGAIAGGEVTALRGIDAEVIGSESAVTTCVTAGVNYTLDGVLAEADGEIEADRARIVTVEAQLKSITAPNMTPAAREKAMELTAEKYEAERRIAAAEKRRNEALALTHQALGAVVVVRKIIYPGAVVRVGDCRMTVNKPLKGPLQLAADRKSGTVRILAVALKG